MVITLGHLLSDGYTAILTPLGPELQNRFGTSIGDIALLSALLSLSSSFIQPVLGIMGERMGRRLMVSLGPVFIGIGLTLMGYVPSFPYLMLLITIAGLGSGFFHPAGAAYIADHSPANKRGLWASLFSAGGSLGMALGPIFASHLGLNGLPWLLPVGVVLGIITYIITPSPSTQNHKTVHLQDYIALFKGPMVTLWGMAVLRSVATIGYFGLLPFILHSRGYGSATIGYSLAVYMAATAIGGIVGGRMSDKIGRVRVLQSSILITLPLFVGLVLSSPNQWWYYPLTFLVGALVNASIPVGVVAAQEYAPEHVAVASSIMMGFSWGTAGLLYWGIGALADISSPEMAMYLSIALLLPSLWLALRLPEPHKPHLA